MILNGQTCTNPPLNGLARCEEHCKYALHHNNVDEVEQAIFEYHRICEQYIEGTRIIGTLSKKPVYLPSSCELIDIEKYKKLIENWIPKWEKSQYGKKFPMEEYEFVRDQYQKHADVMNMVEKCLEARKKAQQFFVDSNSKLFKKLPPSVREGIIKHMTYNEKVGMHLAGCKETFVQLQELYNLYEITYSEYMHLKDTPDVQRVRTHISYKKMVETIETTEREKEMERQREIEREIERQREREMEREKELEKKREREKEAKKSIKKKSPAKSPVKPKKNVDDDAFLEEEMKRTEEERKRFEEERKRLEEERKRLEEKERLRLEEERKRLEEKERLRFMEERKRLAEKKRESDIEHNEEERLDKVANAYRKQSIEMTQKAREKIEDSPPEINVILDKRITERTGEDKEELEKKVNGFYKKYPQLKQFANALLSPFTKRIYVNNGKVLVERESGSVPIENVKRTYDHILFYILCAFIDEVETVVIDMDTNVFKVLFDKYKLYGKTMHEQEEVLKERICEYVEKDVVQDKVNAFLNQVRDIQSDLLDPEYVKTVLYPVIERICTSDQVPHGHKIILFAMMNSLYVLKDFDALKPFTDHDIFHYMIL